MKNRKVGVLMPLWNMERFILPSLEMMYDSVDKIVLMFHEKPFPTYKKEHGYSDIKDRTEELVIEYAKTHPKVEYYNKPYKGDNHSEVFNQGLAEVQDMDIVLKFDTDIFFLQEDWNNLVEYIRNTDYDSYRLNYGTHSVNYYIDGHFDYGLCDAKEYRELIAFDPHKKLSGIVEYPSENEIFYPFDGKFHHIKGWKKSAPEGWQNSEYAQQMLKEYNNGIWLTAPQEIQDRIININKQYGV